MSRERWERLGRLLEEALGLESEERRRFLVRVSADDPALGRELVSLVDAHERPGPLDRPAPEWTASLFADDAGPDGNPDHPGATMGGVREARLERLFEAAALPPEARAAFLEEACGPDTSQHIPEADGDPLVGERVAHYQVLEKLGGGGMGVVYQARDTRLGRFVALKFLPLHLSGDAGARARLVSEARAASALDHPNLAVVHEIGEHQGQLFIAMAFYEGETLKRKLARGALPVPEALDYLAQITEGLQRAHEAGIVHRDIKPANVLITERGQAKLVDFGIAKIRGECLTRTGAAVGTVDYMSPEQARGEAVDHRTDLWSLGVLLYEMLVGERPFRGETAEAVLYAIRHDDPKPPGAASPAVPEGLAGVLRRLLRKDPADRYQDADELLADLRELPGSTAAPLRLVDLSPRKPGKRRGRGMVAALLLVVAAVGVGLWQGASGPREAATLPSADLPPRAASLAVLPLENYSRDPAHEYFAAGMTEELITTLSKIEGLRVIAHRSVRQFKDAETPVREIARSLGVRHVVDGSVLQEGNRVRITASLIDAETEAPVWGDRFERERRDVMGLQREVALAIARAIEVALTPEDESRLGDPSEVDPTAFDLYVRGTQARYQNVPDAFAEAADYFERAIARDSGFAPAYAGLAFINAGVWRGQDASRARWLARRALELDPHLAEAHLALGLIRQFHDRDWAGSEDAFRRAVRLSPGHAEAHHELSMLLMRLRRFDEALREARQALSLAPSSPRFEDGLGQIYVFSGHPEEALEAAERARALDPSFSGSWSLAGHAYTELEQYEMAVNAYEKGIQLGCDYCLAFLGYVYAVSGRRQEALEVIEALKARAREVEEQAVEIAGVYAGLGDRQQALDWLERIVKRNALAVYVAIDPRLRSLYGEPRFQAQLEEMGLGR